MRNILVIASVTAINLIFDIVLGLTNLPNISPLNSFSQELLAEETKEQPNKELMDLGKPKQNQDKDAKDLVKEALKKLDSAKGVTFSIVSKTEFQLGDKAKDIAAVYGKGFIKKNLFLNVQYGKVLLVFNSDEDKENADYFYEYYHRIGANFLVVKSERDEEWEPQPIKSLPVSLADEFKVLLDRIKEIKITGEEKINGKDCYIVESNLNPRGLQRIPNLIEQSLFQNKPSNTSWKLWINKEDGYLYKSIATMQTEGPKPPEPQPFLGVVRGVEAENGVVIDDVTSKSAAEKAGLKEDDIITHFEGKKVIDWEQLQALIDKHKVGDEIKIKILRDEKEMEVNVKLGRRSEQQVIRQIDIPKKLVPITITLETRLSKYNEDTDFKIPEELEELLGLTPHLGVRIKPEPKTEGLLIIEIVPDSPAEKAGLDEGQIIVGIDGEPVNNLAELIKIIKKHKIGDEIIIKILKQGETEPKGIKVKLDKRSNSGYWK